jgi:Phosphate-selective porin O and P
MKLAAVVTLSVLLPSLALAQPTDGAVPPDSMVEPTDVPIDAQARMPMPPPPMPPPPLEPPAADPHGVTVKYDKGLVFETADGDYEMKLGVRSQFRFEAVRPDVPATEFAARFAMHRLRFQLEGHAFGKPNSYKLEFDLANRGFALLKDFYVDHAVAKDLHLRAGQWKRPFNRQEIVSDFGSEFLERSLVNEFAGGGRDLGVAVHNDYEKSPNGLEWAAGLFNATGEKAALKITCVPGATATDPPTCTGGVPTNVPTDFGPALVARVGWNAGSIKGYSEGDLEGGGLRYGVAASYRMNPRDFDKDASGTLQIQHAAVVDAVVKVSGLGITGAAAVVKDGQAKAKFAFYGQVGYMVQPKTLLVAVRLSQVPEGSEHKHEILGAVDWLWKGHNWKWMADGGIIHTSGVSTSDLQIRTQIQAVF